MCAAVLPLCHSPSLSSFCLGMASVLCVARWALAALLAAMWIFVGGQWERSASYLEQGDAAAEAHVLLLEPRLTLSARFCSLLAVTCPVNNLTSLPQLPAVHALFVKHVEDVVKVRRCTGMT